MKKEDVKKFIGKKCIVILKNKFQYTITIPQFDGDAINTTDKFGEPFSVTCDFIDVIMVLQEDRK